MKWKSNTKNTDKSGQIYNRGAPFPGNSSSCCLARKQPCAKEICYVHVVSLIELIVFPRLMAGDKFMRV